MLSIQQALEIKESIKSFLTTTFSFKKTEVVEAFERFIDHPSHGMFKGPYASLKLRFVKASQKDIQQIPLTIKPTWTPYDHQVKSWHKLSAQGKKPEPTIVTTGTGSGKTESFLYPILDYCYHNLSRQGIKVIILYPMNALATDQAKRLAEIIHEDPKLRGKITAGLFIGEGKGAKGQKPKIMSESNIIENNDSILDAPPDIILTNFKMLDYALMKSNYHKLWMHNLIDTTQLKFLVLDELHTYDGAQGTDVANLIRRVKLKLKLEPEQLCPVGTSATIGSGPEAVANLAKYATKVFGENITRDAIITENRISPKEFFLEESLLKDTIPGLSSLHNLQYDEQKGYGWFIRRNIDIWHLDNQNLAESLIGLKIVKDLVTVINKGATIKPIRDIIRDLSIQNAAFRSLPDYEQDQDYNPKERVIESLFTLISEARDLENNSSPFMYLQVQLWVRELSGIQQKMGDSPEFSFRDQIDNKSDVAALPPWYCRECESSGWLGVKRDNSDIFSKDINEIYDKYFSKNKNVYYILPEGSVLPEDVKLTGYDPTDSLYITIDPKTLGSVPKSEKGIAIQTFRKLEGNKMIETCPCCNTRGSISIIGTKIPTLSSLAVSQTLATDLDITDERGRKVLAFTNSVQDAAHQAGFIESRNYRFALRSAVQKVINELEKPVRLSELADTFIKYWKIHGDEAGKEPLNGYLYRFFPKDYLGKLSPKNFLENGVYRPLFLKEFDLRVRWEIYSEFGYNARIGRTLEKTGASAVYFDPDSLEKGWTAMQNWLSGEQIRQGINKERFIRFSNLILHRLRSRGGIDHEYLSKFREKDYNTWDLNWQRDDRHFLNQHFDSRARYPKILTNGSSRKQVLDTTRTNANNWFHAYFKKTFDELLYTSDHINEFYSEWTSAFVEAGILSKAVADDQENYCLQPSAIWVQNDILQYKCDSCGNTQYINDSPTVIENGACLDYRCKGHYQVFTPLLSNYYKEVYNRKRAPRVFSKEHTGLLERDEREALEYDFKNRERFNSVNALIATSTLEMGIDIGNLNVTYNNSIPPNPSNFLQRVGRAGRSTGAATIVNFSKNQNHDLYYFTDPMAMMNGEVHTPGCYLEAKDILRRHFTAYCVDSWTTKNPNENFIPNIIKHLALGQRDLTAPDFFINRLIQFIQTNELELTTNFLRQYELAIKENVFSEIQSSLNSGSFYEAFIQIFKRLQIDLQKLDEKRKDINSQIRALNLAKKDPLYEEFIKEKRNITTFKNEIYRRNILEHLTNCGILPNYAFPETGVTLNARLMSSATVKDQIQSQDKAFEIVRPAIQALRELAPENYFYTQGYRFQISGVNNYNWGDDHIKHTKRFCSKCDHLADIAEAPKGNCPKCGDPSWSSSANTHTYVQMTGVHSFMNSAKAALNDRSDDRDRITYTMMNHVLLDKAISTGAWVLNEIPFGIEYVKNIRVLSANYGRKDSQDARKIRINDDEALRKGFVTCKVCGKSISSNPPSRQNVSDSSANHYGYCRHRDIAYDTKRTDIFEEIYLYREIQTEALKIVLPIQDFETEADISLFQAGLELGFKKYFKGDPSHIHILPYKEYNQKTDKFDRFLLVYDAVPGGTGYLEQLFDHQEFTILLRLGYEAIRDCSCQLEGHDGCYKCIYSYHNQYNRDDLSRAKAEKWFEKINNQTDQWVQTHHGLTSITDTGKIEESELEERFIKLLSIYAEKQDGFKFTARKEEGILTYALNIEKDDIQATYWIRPQVVLGPKDNIKYNTRTDFMITCGKYEYKGKDHWEAISKLAIYLDGYQYHASEEHNVFERDIQIRESIVKAVGYKTWSITWTDLDFFEKQIKEETLCIDPVAEHINHHFKANYRKLLSTIKEGTKLDYTKGLNNVDRLLMQLLHPPISDNELSWFYFLGTWSIKLFEPSYAPSELSQVLKKRILTSNYIKEHRIKDYNALILLKRPETGLAIEWDILVNIGERKVHNQLILNNLENIDKEGWEFFWNLFNIFQSPDFNKAADDLQDQDSFSENNWSSEIFGLYEDYLHEVIQQAINKGVITEDNKDYLDSWINQDKNVLADAELVLQECKVAINPTSAESANILKAGGFSIYQIEDIKNLKI